MKKAPIFYFIPRHVIKFLMLTIVGNIKNITMPLRAIFETFNGRLPISAVKQ